ncbi:PD-(D/E)XK nuclease superfamily protein [Synechococcus sp. BIOS-E4-1]|uniref:hypothetical protein n=1 Tax=Synechococcus sp. BIOS-E4-1 TaxID=1400864 RepID=UPI001643FF20|nr:hypothetical protein [Synechococcus sp. BIOS-E4-1]QNI53360.1 PD-(D/E)XK nuclease superfamily protein [Synechococcus sp. BIOS-E4-1]
MTIAYQGFVVDGEAYPSVSSIIKSDPKHKQSKKSACLANQGKKKQHQLNSTNRGLAVHNACRQYLKTGECDLDPAYFKYFDPVHDLLKTLDLKLWWAEGPVLEELNHLRSGDKSAVWSNKPHKYIGIPDAAGLVGGVPCLLEFKTSTLPIRSNYNPKQFNQYSEWVRYSCAAQQVSAYIHAWNQRIKSRPIHTGLIINSTPEGAQLFIVEKGEVKKRLASFHKLCKEYKSLY